MIVNWNVNLLSGWHFFWGSCSCCYQGWEETWECRKAYCGMSYSLCVPFCWYLIFWLILELKKARKSSSKLFHLVGFLLFSRKKISQFSQGIHIGFLFFKIFTLIWRTFCFKIEVIFHIVHNCVSRLKFSVSWWHQRRTSLFWGMRERQVKGDETVGFLALLWVLWVQKNNRAFDGLENYRWHKGDFIFFCSK